MFLASLFIFLLNPFFIRDKKGEKFWTLVLVHILRGRNHLFRVVKITLWGETLFVILQYSCFLFSASFCCICGYFVWTGYFYGTLSYLLFIYALLFSLHCGFMLDMHTFLCYWALIIACLDVNLHCYVIIVVIFTWLSSIWSSCTHIFHIRFD